MSNSALQQQVTDLTNLVEELQKLLGGQALSAARQGRELAELTARLDDLQVDPGTGVGIGEDAQTDDENAGAPPTPPEPAAWVNYASAHQWRELAAWVDWLQRTYDFRPNTGVPPCWPAHTGVVEELAALRAAWSEAATEARPAIETKEGSLRPGPPADTSAMVHWHDRWLAPLLNRVRTLYQASNCQQGHTTVMSRPDTDTDLLEMSLPRLVPAPPTMPSCEDGVNHRPESAGP